MQQNNGHLRRGRLKLIPVLFASNFYMTITPLELRNKMKGLMSTIRFSVNVNWPYGRAARNVYWLIGWCLARHQGTHSSHGLLVLCNEASALTLGLKWLTVKLTSCSKVLRQGVDSRQLTSASKRLLQECGKKELSFCSKRLSQWQGRAASQQRLPVGVN